MPRRVAEVEGIGPERAAGILEAAREHVARQQAAAEAAAAAARGRGSRQPPPQPPRRASRSEGGGSRVTTTRFAPASDAARGRRRATWCASCGRGRAGARRAPAPARARRLAAPGAGVLDAPSCSAVAPCARCARRRAAPRARRLLRRRSQRASRRAEDAVCRSGFTSWRRNGARTRRTSSRWPSASASGASARRARSPTTR